VVPASAAANDAIAGVAPVNCAEVAALISKPPVADVLLPSGVVAFNATSVPAVRAVKPV